MGFGTWQPQAPALALPLNQLRDLAELLKLFEPHFPFHKVAVMGSCMQNLQHYAGLPAYQKFTLCHFTLQKTKVSTCFCYSKEIRRFSLLQTATTKVKCENHSLWWLRAASTGAARVAAPSSFPGNYAQHPPTIAVSCVCEHLCFI